MTQVNTMIETIRGLFQDSSLLVRQEIELAKAEAGEKIEQAKYGLAELVGGAILALVALFVLAQALVVALANLMPESIAALLVGGVLALLAYFSVSRAQANLATENLKPKRTARTVKASARTVSEATS